MNPAQAIMKGAMPVGIITPDSEQQKANALAVVDAMRARVLAGTTVSFIVAELTPAGAQMQVIGVSDKFRVMGVLSQVIVKLGVGS